MSAFQFINQQLHFMFTAPDITVFLQVSGTSYPTGLLGSETNPHSAGVPLPKESRTEFQIQFCDKGYFVTPAAQYSQSHINDMRVKRYFAPHLISTNYFAAKATPVILKHSESADLLRKSLLPHVLRVPRSFTHL